MSNNSLNKKRKDPMVGLIVLAVLMALLVAGCMIGGSMIRDYRANLLNEKRQAVMQSNAEKEAAYDREVAQYMEKLNQSNAVNEEWPAAAQEGWDIIDLTNYPLEAPGTATVARADIMNNGLLLVNEWHSRPDDFDDSAVLGVSGYDQAADVALGAAAQTAGVRGAISVSYIWMETIAFAVCAVMILFFTVERELKDAQARTDA